MEKLLAGFFVAVGIAYLAYRAHALNFSGWIAAAALGTVVFGLGGVSWALVMLTFFISSSVLSRIFTGQKRLAGVSFSKGPHRDAWQVLANGGIAGLLAFIFFILSRQTPETGSAHYLWIGFASSLAAANADTWATELGLLNPDEPVLISSLKKVAKGTSGAISLVGTLAALAGSALIGGVAVLSTFVGWGPNQELELAEQFLIIAGSGMFGALIDSALGATVQSIYYCPVCKKETEQHPLHQCGANTSHKRGISWINNDWVNAVCTISAGLIGLVLALLIK